MPKLPGEPLRKVTLNLFDNDVQWFQDKYGQGYSTVIRDLLHGYVVSETLGLGETEYGQ